MNLTYQPIFLNNFFIFKQLYKTILFTAVNTSGKKKKGHCVQGDVQEYIIQGITHTRTVIYGMSVLN